MSARKLRGCCEHAWVLAACAFLLWNIPYMTEARWTFDVRTWFPAIWCGLALGGLLLTRRRPGVTWPGAALLAWMTLSCALHGQETLAAQLPDLATGVLAFLVLLPAARVIPADRLRRCLSALLALWTAFMTAQAVIGLWAALSGHAVFSLRGTWYIGVNRGDHRLYLNAYVTTGAVKMGLSALLAGLGVAISRKRTLKWVYALCAAAQLLCLSLTDCRTAFLTVGAAAGVGGAAIIVTAGKGRKGLRWIIAAALVVVMILGSYGLLSGTLTALAPHVPHELDNINLLEIPAHMLPSAAAEDTAIRHRTLSANNLFNNRQLIWRASLRLMLREPGLLLTGTTTLHAKALTNQQLLPEEYAGQPFAHVHNIYLQTLVSWGIPGLLLLLLLIALFLRAAWRVLFRHGLPAWQRLIPVPVLYVLLCELVDCFTRLSEQSPLLLWGCFLAGATLVLDARAAHSAPDASGMEPVDVVIPVYNAAAWLPAAVASALACPAARVILVDDGSTDGSGRLCDELAAGDSRIIALHQPNRGASAARNAGLAAATAPFVAFLDADDVLLPGALERLMAGMEGADAVQGRIVRNAPETIPYGRACRTSFRGALEKALENPTQHLLCHGWLFRRAVLTERFDETLTMGEDGEWLLRTLSGEGRAAFLQVPVYRYTLRPDSALHGGRGDVLQAYMQTLRTAEPTLNALQMPEGADMYLLTHLLLMLTHGCHDEALKRCDEEPFRGALKRVRPKGLSPRSWVLRLLKWRAYPLVKLAVRLRRWQNRQ